MTKHTQPKGLDEGIYFELSNDAYHADPALSRSGIKDILISERDHWENSRMNPDREEKRSEAMKFGVRCEMFLFEEKKFRKHYNIALGNYNAARPETLTRMEFENIVMSARILREDPKMVNLLSNGVPQVSIFYRCPTTGIMLKVRPDLLKLMGCVDLKRVKSIQTNPIGWFIHDHAYDIQEVMCIDAVVQAKQRMAAIDPKFKIVGAHDKAWLKEFMANPVTDFRFIFQRSVKPYIYRVDFMSQYIRLKARKRMMTGVFKYKAAIEKYGTSIWPAGTADANEFQETNLPMRAFGED